MATANPNSRAKLHRFLSAPASIAGGVGVSLGTIYGLVTFDLGKSAGAFALFAFIALVVLTARSEYLTAVRLRTLRGVLESRLAPTPEHLRKVVGEVAGAADGLFLDTVLHWLGGSAFVGLMLRLIDGVPWTLVVRICVFGAIFGPLIACLAHLLVVLRARRVLVSLGELGLTNDDLLAGMPRRRLRLRARLFLFTAIAVLTPAVIVTDLGQTLTRRGEAEIARAPTVEARHEALVRVRTRGIAASAVLCSLVLLCSLATAALVGKVLGDPMAAIAEEAERLARGELGRTPLLPADDEIGEVCAAFSRVQTNMVQVATELRSAGDRIGATTSEIVGTSRIFEHATREQAASLTETSTTTEQLARSAAQIAETATSVAGIAEETLLAAQRGSEDAALFSRAMERMRQDHVAIAAVVQKLASRVSRIGKIVDFINTVADKSDLLALNGELEGTKAQGLGRSFSLVSQEMRRLAENVLESTREIEDLIGEIRQATAGSVAATQLGLEASEAGSRVVRSVSQSLAQIAELAAETSDAVRTISLATHQQQSGTHQLAMTMADILEVTEQGKNTTLAVLSANEELTHVASELQTELDRFKVS